MSTLVLKVYEMFKTRFSETEANLVIEYFDAKAEEKINRKNDTFLVKEDKIELIKTIYIVGLVQFLAIVGSVLMILNFMLKK